MNIPDNSARPGDLPPLDLDLDLSRPAPDTGTSAGSAPESPTGVHVNGAELTTEALSAFQQTIMAPVAPGAYWYDPVCGAWGLWGGPAVGFILAGLEVGGPLPANASNGSTGVFVNGRELHVMDVVALQQYGAVWPGRYWLDARGFFGIEGGPPIGNLAMMGQGGGGGRHESALSSWDRTGMAVYDLS